MQASIRRRYQAFRRIGIGGIVGEDAASCLRLARAEDAAESRDWTVIMEDDDHPWDADTPAPAYVLVLRAVAPCPDHGLDCRHARTLACIGAVGVDSLTDPYLRVLSAELYAEAIAREDR